VNKGRAIGSAVVVLVLLSGVMVAASLTSVSTAADQVALHYEGGPLSSRRFADCVPVSTRRWHGPGDAHYLYPTNQRIFEATGARGADGDVIKVVSKDNVELSVPVSINFTLKTDCETLRHFHEVLGNRYQAYMNGDRTSDGWRTMLRIVVQQPLDTTLDRIAQNYEWRRLYNDPAVKAEIERQVNEQIAGIVQRQTNNEEFFVGWSALVQKPTPTNADLVQAIAAEQNNVAQANAARAKAEADEAAARAQVAVARADADKRKAEIAGYGGVEDYLKAKCIERGCNPYQPTIIGPGAAVPAPAPTAGG
jgi:hypothetical protein